MPIDRKMDTYMVVYLDNGILYSSGNDWLRLHGTRWMDLRNITTYGMTPFQYNSVATENKRYLF